MVLQRIQIHTRLLNMTVANQLELINTKLFAIDVLAFWEDSVGNRLIPLPTGISFGKSKRFVLHFRLNVSQGINEVNFCRSLCANLCIDMHLN